MSLNCCESVACLPCVPGCKIPKCACVTAWTFGAIGIIAVAIPIIYAVGVLLAFYYSMDS